MPLRVGRRIRQLVSQTLCTQRSSPARHIYLLKCPISTRLIPAAAPPLLKFHRNLGHNAQYQASDPDALHQRIAALLSAPTTQETEKELAEFRHAALPSPKIVCLLAEVLAHHAYVPDALDLLSTSRAQGIAIPPRLYEPIVFRLAARYRWVDILALLEPLQPLALGKKEITGHRLTTRLCEWRVRACAELGDFAGMERALGTFPHGITQRAWEIAEGACVKNSDPQTASKIREVIRLARTHEEKEVDGTNGKGKARAIEKSETEQIVQALLQLPSSQSTSLHETSTTTRIEQLPQPDNQTHITYLITTYTSPSSSVNPPSHSFTPDARLAGLCVYELVKKDRVTEAAAVVAAMCRGSPFPEPTSPSSKAQNAHDSPSCTLPEIFASVRPDILIFNALLKGLLATRGLGAMLPLLEIMRNVDVKPDSETAAVLLRHLDRHCAWNPGLLVDTLVDLASPIPKDYANDPAIPPKHQSIPLSIRHTNVLLSSILHAERDATLGGGWKASSAFLKYRARPANRISSSDARLASSPDDISPPTAGLRFKSRADSLKPVLEALRSRGVRNDSMAYALRAQRDGVVQLDPESGRQVLQRADISLGAYHYAALMAGLVECGYMDAAATVMNAAHKAGYGVDSPVLYTILVSGYGRMGIPQYAQRIFDQMLGAKIKPDAIAVDALAGAWFISGLYDRARQVIVKHWPGKGELPFAEDARLKQMINELRKLRPHPKVRRRRFQRVSTEEVETVDQIVEAIKAPDKTLPPAASVKKDARSTSSRGFSSVAGTGPDRTSLATDDDGGALTQSGESVRRGQVHIMSSIQQNG